MYHFTSLDIIVRAQYQVLYNETAPWHTVYTLHYQKKFRKYKVPCLYYFSFNSQLNYGFDANIGPHMSFLELQFQYIEG